MFDNDLHSKQRVIMKNEYQPVLNLNEWYTNFGMYGRKLPHTHWDELNFDWVDKLEGV